jgi:exodeoxyribonuclease V alpha subunit
MKQLDLGFARDLATLPTVHPGLHDAGAVLDLLEQWHRAGWLRELDLRFARFLHDEKPELPGLLLLAAALASHQLGRGHVCLDLAATLRGPGLVLDLPPEHPGARQPELITPAELLAALSLDEWEAALHPAAVCHGNGVAPLVYDRGRLYLYRYWLYEQQVAHGIGRRLMDDLDVEPPAERVRAIVDVLFGPPDPPHVMDWQRLACALAARKRFSIITGGPGTGKTTTVVRLLALLQALHHQACAQPGAWRPLRIQLAAPTGKAAARLGESISGKVDALPFDRLPGGVALADAIPTRVVTLHRLLGSRPHTQARRHDAGNPLSLDVLVIDEASMVALGDMAHVVAALPPRARLVLIGDKDQLSSVEAGAVLGELCRRAESGRYQPHTSTWLQRATGMALPAAMVDTEGRALDQAVAMLRFSHRFDENSGIGQLAAAVNAGAAEEVCGLLEAPPPDLAPVPVNGLRDAGYARLIVEGSAMPTDEAGAHRRHGYGRYLEVVAHPPPAPDTDAYDEWALNVLRAHRSCQFLCVLRAGPWGVEGQNAAIARVLHARGLIPALSGWYPGRPVMVTRNNPALRLTNGDIGVVLPYPAEDGERVLRVAFAEGDGVGVRWFAPNRLDDVETVYALTVHKSQGSEFEHAVLVLPPAPSPVLTRELLYTGITRASVWFTLVNPAGPALLRQAIAQRVHRSGGLGDVLDALE